MEEAKRLSPTTDTLRRLYTFSGNQCSFPGCINPMFNGDGNFVGQICHISAAMPGGERFDPQMTNEERRAFDNLMLMCHDHHIETNKVDKFPTLKLRQFKEDHEKKFNNIEIMIRLMQDSIVDVTSNYTSKPIENLQELNIDSAGNQHSQPFDSDDIKAFNTMVKVFEKLSPQARKTFAISLSRSKHEKNFLGRDSERIYFSPEEIERVTSQDLRSIFEELQSNELIHYNDEISIDGDHVTRGYRIDFKGSEVNFWECIKSYCEQRSLDVVDIVSHMKFTIFDQ